MSYIDAMHDRKIRVVERVSGRRVFVDFNPIYEFYWDDANGKYKSIYGTPVSRTQCRNGGELRKEVGLKGGNIYESDINVVNKCLERNYGSADLPNPHVAFFDIETDFDPTKGFSSPDDPFAKITAITILLKWTDQLITFVMPPPSMTLSQAATIADKFENTIVFTDEAEMLSAFMDVVEDADIISGWNSSGYDIPYVINRITQIMEKSDTSRLCLWDQLPKPRTYVNKFGNEQKTYDLVGRIHLDYMDLYQKYTYEERHSFSLDSISEYELNERKVAYEGTLDALYNRDFERFIEYNRQDVSLLGKLDDKLKFIDITNALAHANTVTLSATMGSVAVIDQAIINDAHRRGMVVPDKRHNTNENPAAGAYVAKPKIGLHRDIGSIDLKSLYPSTIRALNMSIETIIGQIRQTETEEYIRAKMRSSKKMTHALAWEGLFGSLEYLNLLTKNPGIQLTVDWENGESEVFTCAELHSLIFSPGSNLVVSSNGTIFTTEIKGVVPELLSSWYTERQDLQATMSSWMELQSGIKIPERLQ